MKKQQYLPLLLIALSVGILTCLCLSSCNDKEPTWEEYEAFRKVNENYYNEQAARTNPDGTPYYTTLHPSWNPQAEVLIHYFNDRALTAGNLRPMYTSTCAVKYIGRMYNDAAFDSSYLETSQWGDSVRLFAPKDVIAGWTIALLDMNVGDSCEVVIPYSQGYGSSGSTVIPPYATLRFNMKLTNIPYYEVPEP